MFKFVSAVLSVFLVGCLLPTTSNAALDVSGYFDMELIHPKNTRPYFRQHHVNLLLQHSVENYKFFAEVEFEDAVDLDYGRTPINNDGTKNKTGRLYMERAYGEVSWGPLANLKMGQMLHTTYYYLNHYPSLTVNFTDPATRKTLFDYNIKGAIFWGEYKDFYYDVWTGRGPVAADNTAKNDYGMNWGAKVAYTVGSGNKKATFAVLTAEYSNGPDLGVDRSVAGEIILNWNKFTLTSEFGTRTDDIALNTENVGYAIGSYSFDLANGAEISPFLMYDSYIKSSFVEAKTRNSIGLNYKPNALVSVKAEYLTINSYKSTATTTVDSDNQAALAFIYFYN